ncbi:MAG: hypothetical protein EXS00_01880 [Phycisphaerales bacterium]|nr:hypothetical protein [Phycisphaerales bacterium]
MKESGSEQFQNVLVSTQLGLWRIVLPKTEPPPEKTGVPRALPSILRKITLASLRKNEECEI